MQYTNIASKTTTVVKEQAGFLQGFTVVSPGTAWTIQIFDAARGATTNPILGATAMTVPAAGTFVAVNAHFNAGLQVVTAGTTAGELVLTWY